jgi:serine/threonine protein phosphatase PrpC
MSDKEAPKPGAQAREPESVPAIAGVPSWDLEVAELTDVGRLRPHNEDYVKHHIPSDSGQLDAKGAIFVLADGMGGHQAGEVASKGAVELVIQQYYGDTSHDVGTSLVRAFRAANQRIYSQAQADPSKSGMGTTLVAAVLLEHKVYLANVGDSRAYLINHEGIAQISEDHSWVEEQVRAGLLSPEQAQRHPQRNLLTRALGSKPAVEVDLFEGDLNEGDTLLLCSDGLTGRVEDAEIAAIVREHSSTEAARLLVAQANERGGNDNISVMIVRHYSEAPTVVAPLPAAKTKATVAVPLVPILGGAAVLLVLALVGFLVWPMLTGGRVTPIPTASSLPFTETPALTPDLPTAIQVVPLPGEGETATVEDTPGRPTATLPSIPVPTGTNLPSPLSTPALSPTLTAPVTPSPGFEESPSAEPTGP